MENELFLSTGLPTTPPLPPGMVMLNWPSMSSSTDILPPEVSLGRSTQDCIFSEKSTERNIFESALSSLVSSPTASNSNLSGGDDSFILRELIKRLGSIGNSSGEIYGTAASNASGSGSCYVTPISSPPPQPKLSSPMVPTKMTPLVKFPGDPGFAERAAKFSCFGSRSFNGRTTSPLATNNCGGNGSVATVRANRKLPRVSSSPALKSLASEKCKNPGSEDKCPKVSGELSRKRKCIPKGKPKELSASPLLNSFKKGGGNEDSDPKRSKNSEEKRKGGHDIKPSEPPRDYIHVRARRGQATDSHSLAERVRREKISERMKMLQDLVPGCNKVTGKAPMLDEIINYVQSLQQQVEFLSMKLATVNTRLEMKVDPPVSKDMILPTNIPPVHQQGLQLDSTSQTFPGHRYQQSNLQLHTNISSNYTMHQCPIDPLERSFDSHMSTLAQFNDQYPEFCQDDLHSFAQMGFAQSWLPHSQNIQTGSNQASNIKMEL